MFCLNDTMRYLFYSMTLDEFTLVFEAWQQERMYDTRISWEQARFIAQCALMPYSKKGLKARMSWCSIGRKRKSIRGQRPRRQRKMSHGYWRGLGTLKAFPPFVFLPPLFPVLLFPICHKGHQVHPAVYPSGGNARSRWNL